MSSNKNHFDVIVIGGGASGMMAAGVAASRGKSVLLLEKNESLGRKLNITGGGRCNITNVGAATTRAFLAHYGDAGKYFFSPFAQFDVSDTLAFFESRGLACKVEAGGRAFPTSEKATDVTRALMQYMCDGNVTIKTNTPVISLKSNLPVVARNEAKRNDAAIQEHVHRPWIASSQAPRNDDMVRISEVVTREGTYTAQSFILATGGTSHPETGSTGDGFAWLTALGHTIETPNATLVPLKVAEPWVHALAGVTLEHMKITFFADDTRAFTKTGRLLFTHFGISGPLVLNSAKAVSELIKENKQVTAQIDLFPEVDFPALDRRVLATIDANKNKLFKNVLADITPAGMSDAVWHVFALVDAETKAHSLTNEDRKRLVRLLKALPITIEGLMGLDRAIVSDGGIVLDEVDTRTMRSRKIENLYVTGDLLNVNRPSGGYSLQLCWTTGYVAGMHV